jgi:amidophosphoribosyltransferase
MHMEKPFFEDKPHEECGVFGVYDPDNEMGVVSACYYGLYALQHRGQESCGIAINDDGVITSYKDLGLVNEVFTPSAVNALPEGQMGVGHVRYGAQDKNNRVNAQPFVVRHIKGTLALGHNGSLTNSSKLREEYELKGSIFHTTTDAEVIAQTITRERLNAPSIEDAIASAMEKFVGAYSLVIMSPRKLMAVRDPLGFRPLCMGRFGKKGVVFASETCALDSIGATFVRDVEPGEIIAVSADGLKSIKTNLAQKRAVCIFEFIYFARPDSVVDGDSVHLSRQLAGRFLAQDSPADADVVIGVPDSGLDAALGFSKESGIPYGIGFIKNRYIGRTFIAPTQEKREHDVHIKLNALSETVNGKRVVLVDDSIVRGTTSLQIVKMLRKAGATEVHMRLSSPPYTHPCYFGTDDVSNGYLIAHNYSVDEIKDIIGVDSLGYLDNSHLQALAPHSTCGFCDACFSGNYPVPVDETLREDKFSKKISVEIGKNK